MERKGREGDERKGYKVGEGERGDKEGIKRRGGGEEGGGRRRGEEEGRRGGG